MKLSTLFSSLLILLTVANGALGAPRKLYKSGPVFEKRKSVQKNAVKGTQKPSQEKVSTQSILPAIAPGETFFPFNASFGPSSYVNNMNDVFLGVFEAPVVADYIYLNFNFLDMESGYDFVDIYDVNGNLCASYTGSRGNFVSAICDGSSAFVYVSTDGSNSGAQGYDGFSIAGFTYMASGGSNTPPVAIATSEKSSVTIGAQHRFFSSQSFDSDSGDSIVRRRWNFDDGTFSEATNVNKTYSAPGVYDVSLTVWDESGASNTDFISVEVTEVPAPQNFQTSTVLSRSLIFSWQSSGVDAQGFYFRALPGVQSSINCQDGSNLGFTLSHELTGLSPNTNYTVAICAYNSFNQFSDQVALIVKTNPITPPPAPLNLTASNIQARRFRMSWQSGGGNTATYVIAIQAGTTAPSCASGTSVGANTLYDFSGLNPTTNYMVTVCAKNSEGDASSAATKSVTTTAIVFPPAPISVTVTNLFANRATVNWASGGGNTFDYVFHSQAGSTYPNCAAAGSVGTVTTKALTGLTPSTQYSVSICARNSDLDIGSPARVQFTTPAPPPVPPAVTGLAANGVGFYGATLNWTNGGGSTVAYKVLVVTGTTAGNCAAQGVSQTANSKALTGLTHNTQYTASVCALNNIDVAGPQTNVAFKTLDATPPPNPTAVSATAITTSSFTISWSSGGGNTARYKIAMQPGSFPSSCDAGVETTTTSKAYSGLVNYTSYRFRICAISANGIFSTGTTHSVQTLDVVPVNITGLSAVSKTDTSIKLGWSYSGVANGNFLIKRALGATAPANCDGGTVLSIQAREDESILLLPNTNYSYRICTRNASGTQVSNGVAITVKTNAFTLDLPKIILLALLLLLLL